MTGTTAENAKNKKTYATRRASPASAPRTGQQLSAHENSHKKTCRVQGPFLAGLPGHGRGEHMLRAALRQVAAQQGLRLPMTSTTRTSAGQLYKYGGKTDKDGGLLGSFLFAGVSEQPTTTLDGTY